MALTRDEELSLSTREGFWMFKYGSEVVIYVLRADVCANEDPAPGVNIKKKG